MNIFDPTLFGIAQDQTLQVNISGNRYGMLIWGLGVIV
jgi:hypothetical protein